MRLTDRRHGPHEARFEHDGCGIGAVVDIAGRAGHAIVEHGRQILINLSHHGASGSDETTGHGDGILVQIPHDCMAAEGDRLGFAVPEPGRYGLGVVFLPKDVTVAARCLEMLAGRLSHHELAVLGWREVPTDPSCLGELALAHGVIDRGGIG